MIGEPRSESFDAHGLHGADTIEEQFGGLCEHLRNVVGLELAQLDEDRAVEELDMLRLGQLKQLTEQAFDNHVVKRQLGSRAAQANRFLEKLVGAQFSVEEIRVDRAVELFFDQKAFDRVCARQDVLLGHVGVVEHAKDDARQWIQDLVVEFGYYDGRKIVNGRVVKHALELEVRTVDLIFFPVVFFQLFYL